MNIELNYNELREISFSLLERSTELLRDAQKASKKGDSQSFAIFMAIYRDNNALYKKIIAARDTMEKAA